MSINILQFSKNANNLDEVTEICETEWSGTVKEVRFRTGISKSNVIL